MDSRADLFAGEVTPESTGKLDLGPDGGEFTDIKTDKVLTDWTEIFQRFNLDPDLFTISGDTVRMSTWQQSARTADGDRDVVNLYSYRAQFVRKDTSGVDVPEIVQALRKWKPTRNTPRVVPAPPVTLFVGWADWQLGKGEGDGTAGTTQRILDSFEKTEKRIKDLRRQGINVDGLLLANMGDHVEMVTGHYTSQTGTVDLNLRDQLNLAIELNLTGIKALAPLVSNVTYSATICNHGQWQRAGGKQITDDSDNATGFLGETLQTICNLHPSLSHMDWIIPRDEMITTGTFSGVPLAMGHGHKISGDEENWLSKQSARLLSEFEFRVKLWVMAHKHSAKNLDFGPWSFIQCATVDPGSKSFTDATGKFSTQGTTTFLIGDHLPRKHSHYEVL